MAVAKPVKISPVKPAKPNLGPGADNMIAALAKGHADHSKRLDAHDGQLDGHTAQLDGHTAQLGEHHDRISALEKTAGSTQDSGTNSDA
jgi:hypothetical protein